MNDDLISRSAQLRVFPNDGTIFNDNIRMMVRSAPSVDAEPVRHGRWIGTLCSACYSDLSSWADAADGDWHSLYYVQDFVKVTHWMPLPEPPQEEA